MKFFSSKDKKGNCLFEADERRIIIDNKMYYNKDIISLKVDCCLGKIFPVRKYYDRINILVDLPPLLEMTGSVIIETTDNTYVFTKVYCVMEAYMIFKRIYSGTEATYTYRKNTLSYHYNGGLNEEFFQENSTFAVVFIYDKNLNFTEVSINKMKDDWSSYCGFRRCKENENGCFTEYGFFNEDSKWLTFYDDSVEYLNAVGITNQSKIYTKEAHGLPVILLSVYEGEAILISYSINDKNSLFLCDPTEKYYEILKCDEIGISKEYEILDELRENTSISVKEILESKSMSIHDRLVKLADVFGMNSYFIRCGFYDIISMDPVKMAYFKNGYSIIENRIRLDESKIDGPLHIMQQGMPSLEVLSGDKELIYGKEFHISYMNIGEGNRGFIFCFSSDEMNEIFITSLKTGNIPFNVENAEMILLKDDIDTLEKYESYSSPEEMYESIPLTVDYKQVFGRYAFVCEMRDFYIPNGVVINESRIKSKNDSRLVEWIVNRHKIAIRIVFKSEIILTKPLEFLAIPMANVHRGTARHEAVVGI